MQGQCYTIHVLTVIIPFEKRTASAG